MEFPSAKLHEFSSEKEMRALRESLEKEGHSLIKLTPKQFKAMKPMDRTKRKGYMRNQHCPCGSEKKFKRCCWDQYK